MERERKEALRRQYQYLLGTFLVAKTSDTLMLFDPAGKALYIVDMRYYWNGHNFFVTKVVAESIAYKPWKLEELFFQEKVVRFYFRNLYEPRRILRIKAVSQSDNYSIYPHVVLQSHEFWEEGEGRHPDVNLFWEFED